MSKNMNEPFTEKQFKEHLTKLHATINEDNQIQLYNIVTEQLKKALENVYNLKHQRMIEIAVNVAETIRGE